ncbi:MAG TPA: DUF222 domain-containing protein, partial [Propionibacteriaceae bacterium]
MQLGDPTTDERDQRSPLDEALDDAEQALTTMISLLEAGNLDPLSNEQTISWWQRFETFRNKLPLVDHGLITHGEASDLPRKCCSSTMIQFLVRVLQLSHGEAAARVHAAAALGERTSMVGEGLEPLLPQLAALQREGVVSTEKLCRYHHTHFLQKGLDLPDQHRRVTGMDPPRWIDSDQRPQVNARIRRQ